MRRWLDVLLLRVRSLFRRGAVDRELERELRYHMDERIAELVADGHDRSAAQAMAAREFGSVARITDECRDTRRLNAIAHLARDLRYSVRTLVRQPILLIAATTSIGLGVGANLLIFGVANTLFLSKPSAADPDRLVHIRTRAGSHAMYDIWQQFADSGALKGVAGYRYDEDVNWTGRGETIPLNPLLVTANFFEVMGVPMALGRGFTAAEASLDRDPRLVVVSYPFWMTRLGGTPDVLGSSITLDGRPYTVIGVLPANTRSLPGFGIKPDLWLPLSRAIVPAIGNPNGAAIQLIGRLRDGQTVEGATAALSTVRVRNGSEEDQQLHGVRALIPVGAIEQAKDVKEAIFFFGVLLVVTILVLMIACANVAGLLLAQGTVRQRDIALRLSLGASRARIVQQLLTEGFVLSAAGVAAGLALTAAVARALSRISLPAPISIGIDLAFDDRLLWAASALVVVCTLLCALSPALRATKPALLKTIKQDPGIFVHRRFTFRGVLVVGQVTVAMLLLGITVLFLRNLARAGTIDPGFDVTNTLVAQIAFVEGRQGTADAPAIAAMTERLRGLPGVSNAAFTGIVPLTFRGGGITGTSLEIEGRPAPVRVEYANNLVGPRFFETMGIRMVAGRAFTDADRQGAPVVIVINEEFVRQYFDGANPLGRHVYLPASRTGRGTPAEVIGVVANSKHLTIGETPRPAIYEALWQRRAVAGRVADIVVRTSGPADALVGSVRQQLLAFDQTAGVTVEPMETALAVAFIPSRVGAMVIGALGILGTVLAMVGLYSVMSYTVGRRTAEIGVRMALGATRRTILRMVLRDASVLVGIGTTVGLLLAMIAAQPLRAFLVAELDVHDPLTFAATAALLAATSFVAALAPARRATRIQPIAALRTE